MEVSLEGRSGVAVTVTFAAPPSSLIGVGFEGAYIGELVGECGMNSTAGGVVVAGLADVGVGAGFAGTPAHTPPTLTADQLKSIYTCTVTNWHQISSSVPPNTIKPYLPQAGSGTRKFFEGAIGVTDAQIGSCVNQNVIENDGRALNGNANALEPYSIAKWISQKEKAAGLPDITGGTQLKQINAIAPYVGSVTTNNATINPNFPSTFLRLIFNVTKNTNPYTYLFGSTGYVCKHQSIVSQYGFLTLGAGCGTRF